MFYIVKIDTNTAKGRKDQPVKKASLKLLGCMKGPELLHLYAFGGAIHPQQRHRLRLICAASIVN